MFARCPDNGNHQRSVYVLEAAHYSVFGLRCGIDDRFNHISKLFD